MKFLSWTDIKQFHNIHKSLACVEKPTRLYKSKIKLHGTNAGVQVTLEGEIAAQSRSGFVSPGNSDNAGFAAFVEANKEKWASATKGYIYYGEWCGNGIQKGVAISNIGKKIFAIFAAAPIGQSDNLILNPEDITDLLAGAQDTPDVFVLPWMENEITVNWGADEAELRAVTEAINERVLDVEQLDPWVNQTFGVQGVGEGLVYYPFPYNPGDCHLVFKAKGEKHKTIRTAKPAQAAPEMASSALEFAELVLTPSRLEQGTQALSEVSIRQTGAFINWCIGDVEKECQAELEASQISWKDAKAAVAGKAKEWFFKKVKSQVL